jgi:hypothetical protein
LEVPPLQQAAKCITITTDYTLVQCTAIMRIINNVIRGPLPWLALDRMATGRAIWDGRPPRPDGVVKAITVRAIKTLQRLPV